MSEMRSLVYSTLFKLLLCVADTIQDIGATRQSLPSPKSQPMFSRVNKVGEDKEISRRQGGGAGGGQPCLRASEKAPWRDRCLEQSCVKDKNRLV